MRLIGVRSLSPLQVFLIRLVITGLGDLPLLATIGNIIGKSLGQLFGNYWQH
jgi:hypothetical protein